MSYDPVQIEETEGAKRITELCRQAATKRGLVLQDTAWATDIVALPGGERHILTIVAETGIAEVSFTRADVEAYPSGQNSVKTSEKIVKAIEGIL
jgi:hypothetical protein